MLRGKNHRGRYVRSFADEATPCEVNEAKGLIVVDWPTGALLTGIVFRIDLGVLFPLFWKVVRDKDCRNWANGDTSSAVYAFHWINVELLRLRKISFIFPRMNAIDRARIHASRVFHADTGVSDYVSQMGHLYSHARVGRTTPQ